MLEGTAVTKQENTLDRKQESSLDLYWTNVLLQLTGQFYMSPFN
jgi:hypothetical protein